MSQPQEKDRLVIENSPVFVPSLELTKGQPPPVAANGGLSYMSFDVDGDAGTAAAIEAALQQIDSGEGQRLLAEIEDAPPGPIETKWGLGFRSYSECVEHILATGMEAPEGGVVLPLKYTIDERPVYTVVNSNALWQDPSQAAIAEKLRRENDEIERRRLYFPQVMRDARRIEEYYPGLSPYSAECMDKLGVSLTHLESKCTDFYNAHEVARVYYPEIETLLLDFPGRD